MFNVCCEGTKSAFEESELLSSCGGTVNNYNSSSPLGSGGCQASISGRWGKRRRRREEEQARLHCTCG